MVYSSKEKQRKYRRKYHKINKKRENDNNRKYRLKNKAKMKEHDSKRIVFKGKVKRIKFNPRLGVCSRCKKSVHRGEIKRTNMHHIKYDENDITRYTVELCVKCHAVEHWSHI